MHPNAVRLIAQLGLRPHPEGGFFTETYRSAIRIAAPAGERAALTSIYFLLTADSFSAFHRLSSDEIWHHYEGSPVAIDVIDAMRQHTQILIGDGRQRQAAMPTGAWFAAHVAGAPGYALIGCDVAPGFEFTDFEIAARQDLLAAFPQHAELIVRWTREG